MEEIRKVERERLFVPTGTAQTLLGSNYHFPQGSLAPHGHLKAVSGLLMLPGRGKAQCNGEPAPQFTHD